MSRYFKHLRWTHLIVIGAMLLATMGFTAVPIAQTTCGSTYTVQSGDNLTGIATLCDTTVNSLRQANPQITDPNLIYPGEVLNIPSTVIPISGPQVQLAPSSGQAGSLVTVTGTGFPANSALNLTVGQQNGSLVSAIAVNTDSNGNFTTQVTIPSSAQAGSVWTIFVATQAGGGPSASATFEVVAQATAGYYIVQPGDTLSSIANSLGISLSTLEALNPQISNPSLIYPGEALVVPSTVIPVTGSQMQILPSSGLPGTQVTVSGIAFPANSAVEVTVAQQNGSPVSTITVNTNDNGNFTTQVTIPGSAKAGSTWAINAATQASGGPSASASFDVVSELSTGYYTVQSGDTLSSIAQRFNTSVNALLRANPQITNSNQLTVGQQILIPGSLAIIPNTGQSVYIVKQGDSLSVIANDLGISLSTLETLNPQITNPSLIYPGEVLNLPSGIIPVSGPQVQLTPSSGQAGTQVIVSGSAFPASSALNVTLVQQNGTLVSTTTTNTNSSGSFTAQVSIPSSAQAGSIWTVTVATQASGGPSASAQFTVIAETSNGTYTVQSGDTLTGLAQRFGVTVEMLLQANPLLNQLSAGQTINIPETIHFAPGATSQVLQGSLAANSSQYYVLYAQANQLLQVILTPQSGLNLSVTGIDGTVLKSTGSGGASFRGILPSAQYYVLTVSNGNNAVASYTMNVNIPARISFVSGATSASVNGSLAANGNQYYILNAQKNQTMQVQVTPQQGIGLTIYGVDGTVLKNEMSSAASFTGTLPSSQDYVLGLSSTGTATSYTLHVSITTPQSVIPNTGGTVYIVQQGDTLSHIARRFGTTTSALMQANPQITQPSLIFPGERIVIPANNS